MKIVTLSLTCLIFSVTDVLAQRAEPLRGLGSVTVTVQVLKESKSNASSNDNGLSEVTLKSEVELQVRKAGISVVNDSDSVGRANTGRLVVTIRTLKVADDLYAWVAEVELFERAFLLRNPKEEASAGTWAMSQMGTAKDGLRRARDFTSDLITIFTNDYLSVHAGGRKAAE